MNDLYLGMSGAIPPVFSAITDDDGVWRVVYPSENRTRHATISVCSNSECDNLVIYPTRSKVKHYCSDRCFHYSRNHIHMCANCGIEFVSTKSKDTYRFCSRECKELQQCVGGLLELPHYGVNNDYRKTAFANLPNECSDCGDTTYHRLVVHHIDGNRENCDLSNLIILCWNHHSDRHVRPDGLLDFNYI